MHRSVLAFTGASLTATEWEAKRTPPPNNDGVLNAAEASLLNLKGTWLVTLSACDTGRGEARSGEGVLGLRRAFIQAGTQFVIDYEGKLPVTHIIFFFFQMAILTSST